LQGKQKDPSKKGRGKYATFLSETTVNKIINIISVNKHTVKSGAGGAIVFLPEDL